MSDDSLEFWGPILARGPASVGNDQIFEYLSPLDRKVFEQKLRRLDKVVAMRTGGKEDQGRRSALVGRLFEQLLRLLFDGKGAITALQNVRTTTSEIDLLLRIEPFGSCVPMLRNAGTHMIGEAKCHTKPPSSQLADEFVGFLRKHNARLGVLFVNCTSRTLNSNCRFSIALHWQAGVEIVPIGRKQLEEVRCGAPFLRVLRDQHLLASTHSTKLAI